LVDIQTVGVLVTAASVSVAAIYYIMTLRTQQANMKEAINNRRATFTSNQSQYACSQEWVKMFLDVIHMQWSDFEDFKKKYDSQTNPEYTAKRAAVLSRYDLLGRQYKSGLINLDDIGAASGYTMVITWRKFKPIIEGYRRSEYPKDAYSDFEYVATAMMKKLCDNDPDFAKKVTN
jgi:hypothetical protein